MGLYSCCTAHLPRLDAALCQRAAPLECPHSRSQGLPSSMPVPDGLLRWQSNAWLVPQHTINWRRRRDPVTVASQHTVLCVASGQARSFFDAVWRQAARSILPRECSQNPILCISAAIAAIEESGENQPNDDGGCERDIRIRDFIFVFMP